MAPRRSPHVFRPSDAIEVRRSGRHGHGVFAVRDLEPGAVVEECPALWLDDDQWEAVDGQGGLHGYCYDAPGGGALLALGFGSLYNHAADPTLDYEVLMRPPRVRLTTVRSVAAGEELTIRYAEPEHLWFDPR